jgi:CPA2 family monovalent cation:H+ antiporter-2
MVLAESQLSQQAAQETLPLRDAFAVLFFVSVGMLFNPSVLIADPLGVLAVVAIIVFGKSIAAFLIVVAFRYPPSTALTISVSLAQIGEFSFILATLGVDLGLLPERGRDLVLAGSILSIMINPLLFAIFDRMKESPAWPTITHDKQLPPRDLQADSQHDGYAVVVGYGRVGRTVVEGLQERGMPFVIVEEGDELAAEARAKGFSVVPGNAARRRVIAQADLARARWLLVAIPHAFEAARVVMHARAARADLHIIARAHSDAEADHLRNLGASRVIMAEREVAQAMLDDVLAGPAPSAAAIRR